MWSFLIFSKAVSVSFAYVIGMGIMTFSAIMNDKKVTIWHFYDLFSKFMTFLWPFQQLWTTERSQFSNYEWHCERQKGSQFCEWQKGHNSAIMNDIMNDK